MFQEELRGLRIMLAALLNHPTDLIKGLKKAIAWAQDRSQRLSVKITDSVSDFFETKAEFELRTRSDEKPHSISAQLRWASLAKFAGLSALLLEFGLAMNAFYTYITESLGFVGVAAWTISTLLAVVVTVAIAAMFHVFITFATKDWKTSLRTLRRLIWLFVVPSFVVSLFAIVVFVALQRLNTDEIEFVEGFLPAAKITAMLGLMFLGAALLAISELLSWSKRAEFEYDNLVSEKQEIDDQLRAWNEDLEDSDGSGEKKMMQNDETHSARQNGSVRSSANPVVASCFLALMFVSAALGLSGCSQKTSASFTTVKVPSTAELTLVRDDSGIKHEEAYRLAGQNVLDALPEIVLTHKLGTVTVSSFGANVWTAGRDIKVLKMPDGSFLESSSSKKRTDLEAIRPDVAKKKEEQTHEQLEAASTKLRADLERDIRQELASLTVEDLVSNEETTVTDLNGAICRHGKATSDIQKIAIFFTDGRQNLETSKISRLACSEKNVAILFILIPETVNETEQEYLRTKSNLEEAVPWSVVVPYYEKSIARYVAEAIQKSRACT